MVVASEFSTIFIIASGVIGLAYAALQVFIVSKVPLKLQVNDQSSLTENEGGGSSREAANTQMNTVYNAIREGAVAFLHASYKLMFVFIIVFGAVVFLLVGSATNCGKAATPSTPTNGTLGTEAATHGACWERGLFTFVSFAVGALTSMAAGYAGMTIATYANARTTVGCEQGFTKGFNTAYRAGSVMGFVLCSLAVLVLFALVHVLTIWLPFSDPVVLFECIAGFGLGGSSIALFGRVGGGIYTKAADVGADLVGKVEQNLPEDDPRNPATIADNVGDNVGDVAGMGADLFGSFGEATCAALVVAAVLPELREYSTMMFPIAVSALGIFGCLFTALFATDVPGLKVTEEKHVERNLKLQLVISTIVLTPLVYVLAHASLPAKFCARFSLDTPGLCAVSATSTGIFGCVAAGLWAGLLIGYFTDVVTAPGWAPVRELAEVSKQGHAINIIFGLSLGYYSTIVPVLALAGTVYLSFTLGDLYGVAMAAIGMLGNLACGLGVDAFGPISDNAGGIAEMCGLEKTRERTDALDAAGNTTAAVGKGYAIGSAALVGLALFGAFVTRAGIHTVDLLHPITFASLLVGGMIPYAFAAMTMRSVGKAAQEMVDEVRNQIRENPGIIDGTVKPDYQRCIAISTNASLKEMVPPGALVLLTPIVVGFLFGVHAVAGLLAGIIASGIQVAISMSNSGGAWDNAKKTVEKDGGKGTDQHKAAVTGDTVGDPFKDTSGPAENVVMKLSAVVSLVFANFFVQHSLAK